MAMVVPKTAVRLFLLLQAVSGSAHPLESTLSSESSNREQQQQQRRMSVGSDGSSIDETELRPIGSMRFKSNRPHQPEATASTEGSIMRMKGETADRASKIDAAVIPVTMRSHTHDVESYQGVMASRRRWGKKFRSWQRLAKQKVKAAVGKANTKIKAAVGHGKKALEHIIAKIPYLAKLSGEKGDSTDDEGPTRQDLTIILEDEEDGGGLCYEGLDYNYMECISTLSPIAKVVFKSPMLKGNTSCKFENGKFRISPGFLHPDTYYHEEKAVNIYYANVDSITKFIANIVKNKTARESLRSYGKEFRESPAFKSCTTLKASAR